MDIAAFLEEHFIAVLICLATASLVIAIGVAILSSDKTLNKFLSSLDKRK